MPRGGARPNAGAKPGSKHKYDRALAERLAASGEDQPITVLLGMMQDDSLPADVRVRAAAAAAPYVHKRKPQAHEIVGQFEFLSPEEREMRRALLLEGIQKRMAARSGPSEN